MGTQNCQFYDDFQKNILNFNILKLLNSNQLFIYKDNESCLTHTQ